MNTAQRLRERLEQRKPLVMPGAANALTARIIENCGYGGIYVTGAGIANTFLGAPDIGLVTATELAAHVAAIAEAVPDTPLLVDADTGFGNAINVQRTVRSLERAGAAAIQIEDQSMPKKCGHFTGKSLVPAAEMVQKIHAAVDARTNDQTVIVARTDARAVEGFEGALSRAEAYREAGADVLFVEAPQSADELKTIPTRLPGWQLVNIVEGGVTPNLSVNELADFDIVLWANVALQATIHGVERVMRRLAETGSLSSVADDISPWQHRQAVVRKPSFDDLEARYASVDR